MTQTAPNLIAANVRAEMARAGYSARGLADQIGKDTDGKDRISARTLSRRLAGDGSFRIDELVLIAGQLDVPLAALLGQVSA